MTQRRRFDVLLAGYFGFGNFGDEALLASAVGLLEGAGIDRDRICVLSNDTDRTINSLSVISVNRWKVAEVVKAALSSRSFLMPGGGLFQDASSIRSCAYYWGAVKIARACGCTAWAMGQSFAPLTSARARMLAVSAARSFRYLAVRDEISAHLLERYNVPVEVVPDTAWALDFRPAAVDSSGPMLFNIRPTVYCSESLARIADAARIASQTSALRYAALAPEDGELIVEMQERGSLPRSDIVHIRTPIEFMNAASGCSAAIGMRFHFALFSHALGLPVSVSSYDPKVRSLASDLHIPDLMDVSAGDALAYASSARSNEALSDAASKRKEVERSLAKGLEAALG